MAESVQITSHSTLGMNILVVAGLIYCAINLKTVPRIVYFNRLSDCPIVRVERERRSIPVHPITAGSAKLPG